MNRPDKTHILAIVVRNRIVRRYIAREPSARLVVRELQPWNAATAWATRRCMGVNMSSHSKSVPFAPKNANTRCSTSASVFKPTPRRNRSRAFEFSWTNRLAAPAICLRRVVADLHEMGCESDSKSFCCSSVMSRKSDMSCNEA
jgi:hypothetical protein